MCSVIFRFVNSFISRMAEWGGYQIFSPKSNNNTEQNDQKQPSQDWKLTKAIQHIEKHLLKVNYWTSGKKNSVWYF